MHMNPHYFRNGPLGEKLREEGKRKGVGYSWFVGVQCTGQWCMSKPFRTQVKWFIKSKVLVIITILNDMACIMFSFSWRGLFKMHYTLQIRLGWPCMAIHVGQYGMNECMALAHAANTHCALSCERLHFPEFLGSWMSVYDNLSAWWMADQWSTLFKICLYFYCWIKIRLNI